MDCDCQGLHKQVVQPELIYPRHEYCVESGKEHDIRAIEKPFYVEFQCVGDWQRAMEEGPRLFCDWPVLLKEYDGFSKIDMGDMNSIDVFVRAMKVPDGLINKAVAKVMGDKVGNLYVLL